jgi:hypothetical protein
MIVPRYDNPLKDFNEVEDWITKLHNLEVDDGTETK